MIPITQTIPCNMHIENHVGEKLITALLAMGSITVSSGRRGWKSHPVCTDYKLHCLNKILESVACL